MELNLFNYPFSNVNCQSHYDKIMKSLQLTVGDEAQYKKIAGFDLGTSKVLVRELTATITKDTIDV